MVENRPIGARGRPQKERAEFERKRRLRRIQAALNVEDYVYLGILELLDPKQRAGAESRMRERLLSELPNFHVSWLQQADEQELARFPVTVADIGIDPAIYEKNVRAFTLPDGSVLEHDPQRIASRMVGPLFGYGKDWLKDLKRLAPPGWIGKRRKYASAESMSNNRGERAGERAGKHAGKYDPFTRWERLFFRLPPEAQKAIDVAVRKWRDSILGIAANCPTCAKHYNRSCRFPAQVAQEMLRDSAAFHAIALGDSPCGGDQYKRQSDLSDRPARRSCSKEEREAIRYLHGPFEDRVRRPPKLLRDLVGKTIDSLPPAIRRDAFKACRRPLREKPMVGGLRAGAEKLNDEIGDEIRVLLFEETQERWGNQSFPEAGQSLAKGPHYYETPLPVLGPPPKPTVKIRRRSHPNSK